MIPKNIFQTHKSPEYLQKTPELFKAAFTWYKHKDFNYKFYSDTDCDEFMLTHYPDIYPLYKKLPLAVMKADLWRYCIIYKYGGIYADVDTILKTDPNMFIMDKDLVIVSENQYNFCQWVFAAPPGSPIIKTLISLIVSRLNANIKEGSDFVLKTTGPIIFTEAINQYVSKYPGAMHETHRNLTNNIHLFDHKTFHSQHVIHLFYGCKRDGWMKERNQIIKRERGGGGWGFSLNMYS